MLRRTQPRIFTLAVAAFLCPLAHAAEHITLRNGFELDCARREVTGNRVRLYLLKADASESTSYLEVAAEAIARTEPLALDQFNPAPYPSLPVEPTTPTTAPTKPLALDDLLARAGTLHNIDVDLLASVVKAESGGQVRAVSRTGARGLMQLMPGTAAALGVHNSFAPDQNIAGGSAYLDALLTRYHDDISLALAAYNAGPAAVDRYHGIPPFTETRAYVARVIREFNRRKLATPAPAPQPDQTAALKSVTAEGVTTIYLKP